MPVPDGQLTEAPQIVAFYQQVHDRIAALPGVSSVSVSLGMPIQGVSFGMPFTIESKPVEDVSQRPLAGFDMVTPDYFQTFGIRFDMGRALTEQDRASGVRVAVVNQTFAKKYLSGVDPLAQRILVEQLIPGVTKLGSPIAWQIVGVYHDVRNGGVRGDGFSEIDVPFAQSPWPVASVAVRGVGDRRRSPRASLTPCNPSIPICPSPTSKPWTKFWSSPRLETASPLCFSEASP